MTEKPSKGTAGVAHPSKKPAGAARPKRTAGVAHPPPWEARVITLFPDMFPGPLGQSLAGKALARGIWSLAAYDIRRHAIGRHRLVDDKPYGGGPGMVMRPDVIAASIDEAWADAPDAMPLIYFTPRGTPLTQTLVRDIAAAPGAVMLCGRYEGVDERVLDASQAIEISIGDYILAGGEIAALVLLDAVIRLLPGVLGNAESATADSFESGLLEHPLYTQPRIWQGRAVPEILTGGNHQAIEEWRKAQAQAITRSRRPDLWAKKTHK